MDAEIRFKGNASDAVQATATLRGALGELKDVAGDLTRALKDALDVDSKGGVAESNQLKAALGEIDTAAEKVKVQLKDAYAASSKGGVTEAGQMEKALKQVGFVAGVTQKEIKEAYSASSRGGVTEANQLENALEAVDRQAATMKRELKDAYNTSSAAGVAQANAMEHAVKDIDGNTKKLGGSMQALKLLSVASFLAIGGAAVVAGAAIVGAFAVGLKEMAAHDQIFSSIEAHIKSTGGAANVTADHIDKLSSSLMRMSGADDEAIAAGASMLLTFTNVKNAAGEGNDIFDQSTKALLNMATAMNNGVAPSQEQMSQSAIKLGKALNDPIKGMTALSKVGVAFTADQKAQIEAMVKSGDVMGAQKIILAELTKEFGGTAEAAGKTLPGQLNVLKETFSNVMGDVATRAMPLLTKAMGGISDALPAIEKGFTAFGEVVFDVVTKVGTKALPIIVDVAKKIPAAFEAAKPLVEKALGLIGDAIATLLPIVESVVKSVGPVLLSLGEIALDGAQKILKAFQDVIPKITATFASLGDTLAKTLAGIRPALDAAFAGVADLIKPAADAARQFASTFEELRSAIDKIIGPLDQFIVPLVKFSPILLQIRLAIEVLTLSLKALALWFELIGKAADLLWAGLDKLNQALGITDKVQAVGEAFGDLGGRIGEAATAVAGFVADVAADLARMVTDVPGMLKAAWNYLTGGGLAGDVRAAAVAVGSAVWDGIKTGLSALAGLWLSYIRGALEVWATIVGFVINGAKAVGEAVWNGIKAGLAALGALFLAFVRAELDGISTLVGWMVGLAKSVGGAVWDGIKAGLSALGTLFVAAIRGYLDGIIGLYSWLLGLAKNLGEKVWDGIKAGLAGLGASFLAALRNALDNIKSLGSWVLGLAKNLGEKVIDGIIAGIKAVAGIGTAIAGKVKDGIASVAKAIWEALKGLGERLVDGIIAGIKSMGGALKDAFIAVLGDAKDKAISWLKPGSPSKLFADEVGKPIGAGIKKGAEDELADFGDVLSRQIGNAMTKAQASIKLGASGGGGPGGTRSSPDSMGGAAAGGIVGYVQAVAATPGANAASFSIPGGDRAGALNQDCSSFVQAAYAKYGVKLGSNTYSQIKDGQAVKGTPKPGDILLFNFDGGSSPEHVSIYVGGGMHVHDHGQSAGVEQTPVPWNALVGVRRVGGDPPGGGTPPGGDEEDTVVVPPGEGDEKKTAAVATAATKAKVKATIDPVVAGIKEALADVWKDTKLVPDEIMAGLEKQKDKIAALLKGVVSDGDKRELDRRMGELQASIARGVEFQKLVSDVEGGQKAIAGLLKNGVFPPGTAAKIKKEFDDVIDAKDAALADGFLSKADIAKMRKEAGEYESALHSAFAQLGKAAQAAVNQMVKDGTMTPAQGALATKAIKDFNDYLRKAWKDHSLSPEEVKKLARIAEGFGGLIEAKEILAGLDEQMGKIREGFKQGFVSIEQLIAAEAAEGKIRALIKKALGAGSEGGVLITPNEMKGITDAGKVLTDIIDDIATQALVNARKLKLLAPEIGQHMGSVVATVKNLSPELQASFAELDSLFAAGVISKEDLDRFNGIPALIAKAWEDGVITPAELAAIEQDVADMKSAIDQGRKDLAANVKLWEAIGVGVGAQIADNWLTPAEVADIRKKGANLKGAMKEGLEAALTAYDEAKVEFDAAWATFKGSIMAYFDEVLKPKLRLQIDTADAKVNITLANNDLEEFIAGMGIKLAKAVEGGPAGIALNQTLTGLFAQMGIDITTGTAKTGSTLGDAGAGLAIAWDDYYRIVNDSASSPEQIDAAIAAIKAADKKYDAAIAGIAPDDAQGQAAKKGWDGIIAWVKDGGERAGAAAVTAWETMTEETKVATSNSIDDIAKQLLSKEITWKEAVGMVEAVLKKAGVPTADAAKLLGAAATDPVKTAFTELGLKIDDLVKVLARIATALEKTATDAAAKGAGIPNAVGGPLEEAAKRAEAAAARIDSSAKGIVTSVALINGQVIVGPGGGVVEEGGLGSIAAGAGPPPPGGPGGVWALNEQGNWVWVPNPTQAITGDGPPPPPDPGSCFVAGTLVRTPSGPRPIETIEVGDVVLSWSFGRGVVVEQTVRSTHRHAPAEGPRLVRIVHAGGTILATPEHPFWNGERWQAAATISADVDTLTFERDGELIPVDVDTADQAPGYVDTYNLTVDADTDDDHNYFAGGALVHNAKIMAGGGFAGIQRLAAGGVSGWVRGMRSAGIDKVLAALTPGELVLNEKQQSRLAGVVSGLASRVLGRNLRLGSRQLFKLARGFADGGYADEQIQHFAEGGYTSVYGAAGDAMAANRLAAAARLTPGGHPWVNGVAPTIVDSWYGPGTGTVLGGAAAAQAATNAAKAILPGVDPTRQGIALGLGLPLGSDLFSTYIRHKMLAESTHSQFNLAADPFLAGKVNAELAAMFDRAYRISTTEAAVDARLIGGFPSTREDALAIYYNREKKGLGGTDKDSRGDVIKPLYGDSSGYHGVALYATMGYARQPDGSYKPQMQYYDAISNARIDMSKAGKVQELGSGNMQVWMPFSLGGMTAFEREQAIGAYLKEVGFLGADGRPNVKDGAQYHRAILVDPVTGAHWNYEIPDNLKDQYQGGAPDMGGGDPFGGGGSSTAGGSQTAAEIAQAAEAWRRAIRWFDNNEPIERALGGFIGDMPPLLDDSFLFGNEPPPGYKTGLGGFEQLGKIDVTSGYRSAGIGAAVSQQISSAVSGRSFGGGYSSSLSPRSGWAGRGIPAASHVRVAREFRGGGYRLPPPQFVQGGRGGDTHLTINVGGSAVTERQLIEVVRDGLVEVARRNGNSLGGTG